jgi:hypothetical protein
LTFIFFQIFIILPRLANIERMKFITKFNDLSELQLRNTCKKLSKTIKEEGTNISEMGVRNMMAKWLKRFNLSLINLKFMKGFLHNSLLIANKQFLEISFLCLFGLGRSETVS